MLVGKDDAFYQKLRGEVAEIGIAEQVIFTGFVSDEELAKLYADAALYIFPSRFEGFGLPPLEAMMHGTPVASSTAGPLPEVLGDAALYFDPNDLEQIVAAMETALTNQEKMAEMRAKGPLQAKKYSWKTMAHETLRLYEQTAHH